ncbi:MAG: helix-turn-helix domain-containing protein [Armatimonadota bacterium]
MGGSSKQGDNLKRIMKKHLISVRALADKSGVSNKTIEKARRGLPIIQVDKMKAILKALNDLLAEDSAQPVSADDIFTPVEEKEEKA